jgi:polar amino acid transport system substrate-binding protein
MFGTSNTLRRLGLALACAALVAGAAGTASAQDGGHNATGPLVIAMDVGYAPWAMQSPDGKTEGFQVDVMNEVARQLGRPGIEVIDTNFSAIFAGLFASRYELIGSPIAITADRSKEMAFTEAFISNGQAFITKGAEADFADLEALRGKEVATNSGSTADKYLTENAEKYGWSVQRYDKDTDAVQAVITNRAYAAMTDVYRGRYSVASAGGQIKVSHVMNTQTQVGLAIRLDDKEFLALVEGAIECMKMTGKFAEIHQKWFGVPPAVDTVMNQVFVGIGPVGFEGYDAAAYHAPSCK